MSVIKHFNTFLFVFFIIGVAPFHSEFVNKNVKTKKHLVPATISSILIVSVGGFLLYCNYLADFGQINTIVNCFSLLSGLAFCLSAIFQRFIFPSIYQNLINKIVAIEKNLEKKFSEKLPLSSFAKRYKQKVLLLFLCLVLSITSSTIELWKLFKMNGVLIVILQSSISAFSGLALVHFILYVDMVEMFFGILNRQIQNATASLNFSHKKIEFLKYVKLMHMDLWTMIVQINDFFSWSLLLFMLNYVIYMVYDLYVFFLMLQGDDATGISGSHFLERVAETIIFRIFIFRSLFLFFIV